MKVYELFGTVDLSLLYDVNVERVVIFVWIFITWRANSNECDRIYVAFPKIALILSSILSGYVHHFSRYPSYCFLPLSSFNVFGAVLFLCALIIKI